MTARSDDPAHEVLEIARIVLSDLDVEVVLGRVLDSARELTGARYAAMGILNDARSSLARFVTSGIDDELRAELGSPPTGHGLLGELIRAPRPLRVANVGRHPRSYGFPAGHPPMEAFLGVPILVDGEPFGNLYLTDKEDGGEFTDADEEALVLLGDVAGIAIDHARRLGGAEARSHELTSTVAALDATVSLARVLAGQTDLRTIVELVAKRGRALIAARALVIELVRDARLDIAFVAGDADPAIVGRSLPLEGSAAELALARRRPHRLHDELSRARLEEHGVGRLGLRAHAALIVPLAVGGRHVGALVAVDRLVDGPRFTDDDERMLEAFAVSAAASIATAQLVASEHRGQRLAAAEQERARWARELHDETLQGLAAVGLGLSAARRSGDAEVLDAAVGDALGALQAEIDGLRALITELRPPALDQLGPEAALTALAERACARGLTVDARIDLAYEQRRRGERHAPEIETALYRIVQESLTNAVKHGGATHAVVEVVERPAAIDVTVRDDGAGFDATAPTAGLGLLGMRERVELLNGSLRIDSAPGQGTVVRAQLPVAGETAAGDVALARAG